MALPTTRDLTLSSASAIPNALLNKLQDCVIGHKKPSLRKLLNPQAWMGMYSTPWVPGGPGLYVSSNVMGAGYIGIPIEVGDRITNLELKVFGNGVTDITFTVQYIDASMVLQTLGTVTDTNRTAAWATLTVPSFVPHVMAAGESLQIFADVNASGYRIGPWWYDYDRL